MVIAYFNRQQGHFLKRKRPRAYVWATKSPLCAILSLKEKLPSTERPIEAFFVLWPVTGAILFILGEHFSRALTSFTNHTLVSDAIFFKDKLGEAVTPGKISDGSAVTGMFGQDPAVVTKKDDVVSAMSAVCTHKGCTVGFNGDKKTLDCPCHGSRYHLDGAVLNGPAKKALPAIPIEVRDNKIWKK
jgi:Rieske Fe-S protein